MKRSVKRAVALENKEQGRICDFTGVDYTDGLWTAQNPEDFTTLSYGDLSETKTPTSTSFFLWSLATGSDYSGSDVEVSNHRVLLELAGEEAKKFGKTVQECGVFDVYGGYSTYSVAVRLNCPLRAVWEAIQGCIEYPVLDDDDLYVVEQEAQQEALESWARSEFRSALSVALDEYEEWDLDEIPASDLDRLFQEAAETANEYWINETGNTAYIDTKKVAAAVTIEELVKLPGIVFLGEPEDRPAFMLAEELEAAGQLTLAL